MALWAVMFPLFIVFGFANSVSIDTTQPIPSQESLFNFNSGRTDVPGHQLLGYFPEG
jgi:hypothetical protein